MELEKNIALYFWCGTFLMLFFAIGIFIFVTTYWRRLYQFRQNENDKLMKSCLAVERNERKNISSYLHDTVCNDLYAVSINLTILQQSEQEIEKLNTLADIQQQLDCIMNKTRNLSYLTMSPLLEFYGLVAALQDFFKRLNKLNHLHISFQCRVEIPKLDMSVSYEIYRIVQEMTTNMIKHGEAKHAHIVITRQENHVIIILQDDGIAFDMIKAYKESKGMGIKNIFFRAKMIQAKLKQQKTESGNKFILKFNLSHD